MLCKPSIRPTPCIIELRPSVFSRSSQYPWPISSRRFFSVIGTCRMTSAPAGVGRHTRARAVFGGRTGGRAVCVRVCVRACMRAGRGRAGDREDGGDRGYGGQAVGGRGRATFYLIEAQEQHVWGLALHNHLAIAEHVRYVPLPGAPLIGTRRPVQGGRAKGRDSTHTSIPRAKGGAGAAAAGAAAGAAARAACGVRRTACGVRRAACGVRRVACGVRRAACGVRRAA